MLVPKFWSTVVISEIRRPELLNMSTAYLYKLLYKSYSGASHPL